MINCLMDRMRIVDNILHSSDKKLLDININFDTDYPIITYTYFDKEKREEIIETYCAYSMSIRDDFNDDEYLILQGRKRFFDRTFEMKDMSLISKDINKL